jgi:hypothetical protein
MEALLQFLETYEVWIYVILGAVGLVYFRKTFLAWKEWRTSAFGLERENAQRRFSSSITVVILLALMGMAELVLVSFISPVVPQLALQTPTVSMLVTPTVTLRPNEPTPTVSTETQPTQLISSTTTADGCVPGQVEWTSPKSGDEVKGAVELKGTVNIPDLGYYKYEYSQQGSDSWTIIAGNNQTVVDGQLGVWNTDLLVAGDYQLRLVVSDSQDNTLTPCGIKVTVAAQ